MVTSYLENLGLRIKVIYTFIFQISLLCDSIPGGKNFSNVFSPNTQFKNNEISPRKTNFKKKSDLLFRNKSNFKAGS